MTVLIAGAGPAGSFLANKLSKLGHKVILVERLDSPNKDVFSSAAIPIEALSELSIPLESVSTYWSNWCIYGPDSSKNEWFSGNHLGAVLDFGKLREYLWNKAISNGIEFLKGFIVLNVCSYDEYALVKIKNRKGIVFNLKVNIVVDATGYRRSLIKKISQTVSKRTQLISGNGLEWILFNPRSENKRWNDKLTFFIGSNWVRNGYGWIFPMSNNRLKVGVCRLLVKDNLNESSNIIDLNHLITNNYLDNHLIVEKNGGMISSTVDRSDIHCIERVIAVGDSVSTANLLGGEGIRHAITSANILADVLNSFLCIEKNNSLSEFKELKIYKTKLKENFGWRWYIANKIGTKIWTRKNSSSYDKKIIKLIKGLKNNYSSKDMSDLLFNYKFDKYGLRLLPYLLGIK